MSSLPQDARGPRVLVVDYDAGRRSELISLLSEAGYTTVVECSIAAGAVAACGGVSPDIVLIGVHGDEPGPEPIARLGEELGGSDTVPIIGVLGSDDPAARTRAAGLGLFDVAIGPIGAAELRMRVENGLARGRLRRLLSDRSARLTEALRDQSVETDTVRESLSIVAAMADFHDDDGDHHARRVGVLSAAIARALGLSETSTEMLAAAAPLHDIGKVGISRRILLKPGKLSPSEWLHMQHHVDIGARILGEARSPVLVLAGEIARTHHERWDGSGYTTGLRGEEIPLSGRIVALADVWDTLTHDRPYRPAWDADRALAEIQTSSGTHFDPRVVEAFISLDLDALVEPAQPIRAA